LLTSLRRAGATVFPATPWLARTLTRLLRRGPDDGRADLTSLRLLTSTGAAMPPATVATLRQQLPGLRVQLMFGLTECKRVAVMPPDGDLDRPDSSGLPLPGTEVIVVDERGAAVPPGTVGEVVVRGPHVMSGYWRSPEATAERFRLRDGLFPQLHTGDIGWLDREGYLYFVGRRDDIYKSRGFRVSAVEVEAAACRVPGVRRAAVLPPGAGRTTPVLFAATARTPDMVLAGLRQELEDFKIPAECVVLDTLPENGNGKVDKVALVALAGQETADAR
jgi:acyl-CoA synthetase (AMP-forming)/AMP-acid ligase II